MSLPIEDRLKWLVPAAFYYPYKVAKESRRQEPELARLRELVPARGTAIDVGANRGIYSYALSRITGRVEAFEPNPFLAEFMRRKLGSRVNVHELALSDFEGTARFFIPQDERGVDIHVMGHLDGGDRPVKLRNLSIEIETEVQVAILDRFDFDDVVFIKIDVEGSDMAVVEGAQLTIAKHKPALLIELLAGQHDRPEAKIAMIESRFGYKAQILVDGGWLAARQAFGEAARAFRTQNVVFAPA